MLSDDSTLANPYAPPRAEVEDMLAAADGGSEPYMLPCSPVKLVVLSTTTFNVYLIYWFWKNFRYEQGRNPEIWPVLRTIFSGIFFYTLARSALDEAESRGIRARYSPVLLTALFLGTGIGTRFLPDIVPIVAIFLLALIVMPVQLVVNRINRHINPLLARGERFRIWEIVIAVPGGLLLLFAIVGLLFLPDTGV
ncbi:MAG TPA: hypothetical protein VFO31_14155 [Vicinamibacterales bacterium]|nr:hypothetical protein [Vicinamibacterales bacterium]